MTSKLPKQHFYKVLILIIILFQVSFSSYAQKKQTYNLLWEITGKSLTKPSYVFGAARFNNHKLFNFSDSVMTALQSSSTYVLELHPDSLIRFAFQQLQSIDGVKESLTPLQAKTILDRFKVKNGYAADSSFLTNPFKIAELMRPDYSQPTDMPSSVDNYLYGVARTLKKKVLSFVPNPGVINYTNAKKELDEILENLEEEEPDMSGFDELMDVYGAGNIDDVLNFINAHYEDGIDFSAQNKLIADRMVEMLNSNGLFFAVPPENIAGYNGVLALLKKAGYNVREVEATFTGVAKNYDIDYAKMDWYTHENKADQFAINFPSTPLLLNKTGNAKVVAYSDVTNGVILTASSLFTGPLTNLTSEQYIDTVFNLYSKSENFYVLSKKKYAKYGATVLDVDFKKNGKYSRMLIIHHNLIYYTISIDRKLNNLHDLYADLFFNSFKLTDPIIITANDWFTYENKRGAFSLKIPIQPEENQNQLPNTTLPDRPYKVNLYSSSDKANKMNYIFRYNEFPAGMYLSDKQAVFDGLTTNIEKNGKIVVQKRKIYKDGYEGRTLSAIVQGTYMELQVYLRGNRTYFLLSQNLSGPEKPKNNTFFESFKFLPYISLKGDTASSGNMETMMPEIPFLSKKEGNKEDEEDDKYTSFLGESETLSATNQNTGGSYGIERSKISKYFRSNNIDSLYTLFVTSLNPTINSAVKPLDVTIGNVKGKELITTDSLSNTRKKTRMWFDGDQFYYQTLISSAEEIENGEFANIFFNNVRLKGTQPLFDFKSSKAKLITQDLLSKDAETYKKALGALSYYKFDKEELPMLYTALKQKYVDDTTSSGARTALLKHLAILKDDKTTDFLKTLYQQSKNSGVVQGEILSMITGISADNYDWYLKSLTEAPLLPLANRWDLFEPLTDSIAYTAAHLDQILPMLQLKEDRPMILNVVSTLLNEKNKANYETLVKDKKDLIGKYAIEDLDEDIKNLNEKIYPSTTYSYLAILPVIDPKLTDEFTKKILALDSVRYLITEAFAARITANLLLNEQLLSAQLDSLNSRYRVMYAFYKAGKLANVPAKYKRHDEFAKLLLRDYLIEEYGEPKQIQYLGAVKDGKDTYFAFDFSYIEDDVTKNYVGISGPFSPPTINGDELDFDKYISYSDFEPKSKDWMKQVKEMIKALKKPE